MDEKFSFIALFVWDKSFLDEWSLPTNAVECIPWELFWPIQSFRLKEKSVKRKKSFNFEKIQDVFGDLQTKTF